VGSNLTGLKEGSVCRFTGWAVNSIAKAIEGSNPFLPNIFLISSMAEQNTSNI
jgi:hypothetical protein